MASTKNAVTQRLTQSNLSTPDYNATAQNTHKHKDFKKQQERAKLIQW